MRKAELTQPIKRVTLLKLSYRTRHAEDRKVLAADGKAKGEGISLVAGRMKGIGDPNFSVPLFSPKKVVIENIIDKVSEFVDAVRTISDSIRPSQTSGPTNEGSEASMPHSKSELP